MAAAAQPCWVEKTMRSHGSAIWVGGYLECYTVVLVAAVVSPPLLPLSSLSLHCHRSRHRRRAAARGHRHPCRHHRCAAAAPVVIAVVVQPIVVAVVLVVTIGCSCRFDYFQIEDGWLRPMPPSWIGFLLCGIGHFASRPIFTSEHQALLCKRSDTVYLILSSFLMNIFQA
uniref:Uncharacterized protein n=1 Tax=Oryza rufipogon TaxID=4529 RepID=A0A0E0P757_ORYRU